MLSQGDKQGYSGTVLGVTYKNTMNSEPARDFLAGIDPYEGLGMLPWRGERWRQLEKWRFRRTPRIVEENLWQCHPGDSWYAPRIYPPLSTYRDEVYSQGSLGLNTCALVYDAPIQQQDDCGFSWQMESTQLFLEHEEELLRPERTHQAYQSRLEELRQYAKEDDECSDIKEPSRNDFFWFVESVPFSKKAELVLLENGNIRAVWTGQDKTHIGIQFLGDKTGQYVIFAKRPGAKRISRVAGVDTLEGLKRQVQAFDIDVLGKR